MKSLVALPLLVLALAFAGCTFVPETGMAEKRWLRHNDLAQLVYIEGNIKAYRSGGSYYYFKDGLLVQAGSTLIPASTVASSY